ncbi:MAG: hypothetical protein AB8H86_05930 [Polyangiales bacterium]
MRVLLTAALCAFAVPALAQSGGEPSAGVLGRIPTCVSVSSASEADALARLVRLEVDRHASHQVAQPDCTSRMHVELFTLEGRRWLTGRIDDAVPHRLEVEDSLELAIEELVTILLHNDPQRLRRPSEDQGLSGALGRLQREGNSLWSLEVFELLGLIEGELYSATGFGFAYRREHAQWSLALHVAVATRTSAVPQSLALMVVGDVAFDVRYAFSSDAAASGFLGLQLGLEHQWMRGPLASDPSRRDSANRTGLFVGMRGGVELFRTTRSRLELFVQANLPLFRARDEEGEVVKNWFPTARVGIALGL